jgi:uncharacterized protein YegL
MEEVAFQQQILPFYLVCDESHSMAGSGIDAINDSLPDLHAEISTNPMVADKTRFSMIGFADDAQVLLELSDLSDVDEMPAAEARGGTSFAAAFRLLETQIAQDVAMLKRDGHKVFRPVVFFMTDGNPLDDEEAWRAVHKSLLASDTHPEIVAFGVGENIDEEIIKSVATFKAFVTDNTLSPAAALKEFAKALTNSIVASGSSVSDTGDLVLQVPAEVDGFTALPLDAV